MKRTTKTLSLSLLIGLSLVIFAGVARAQDQGEEDPGPPQDQQDQPASGSEENGPGVARIGLMTGEVSTQRGDSGDWVAATVNAPLEIGDRVATAAHSRAEIQLDYGDIVRLNENSEVRVADLANNHIQVQVASGLVDYVVLKDAQAATEVDTPNVAVQPKGEGVFRIQVNGDGETLVTVRRGQAQVSTPQGSADVRQGETLTAQGATGNVQYRIDPAPRKDEWDAFNEHRDKTIMEAQSYRYTNRYYTGASDLDQHGRWENVPGYDWCWTPYVDAGWVPYTDGRWTWEPYYGWTWVSYEPWGWAPYHYGRWFNYHNAWSWWPGPVWGVGMGYRPLWSPAYVAFLGIGRGIGIGIGLGFGFGHIGWLPIGPGDCFFPWWGRGGWGRGGYYNHYNEVNITNITNIRNINNIRGMTGINNAMGPLSHRGTFSNLAAFQRGDTHVGRAFSVVSGDRFGQGGLRGSIQHPGYSSSLGQGRLIAGGLPVTPTRASLSPGERGVNSSAIPRTTGRQGFFSRQQPGTGPEPFSQRAAQVQQMVRRGPQAPGSETRAGFNANSPMSRGANTGPQQNRAAGSGGNLPAGNTGRRFETGAPGANGNGIAEQRTTPGAQNRQPGVNSGWRRFGSQPGPGAPSGAASGTARGTAPAGGYSQQPRGQYPQPTRSGSAPVQNGTQNGGWRRFAGSAPGSAGMGQQAARPAAQPRPGNYSNQSGASRWQRSGVGSQRPPLQLNKPIVTSRSPNYGGGYSAPRNYGGGYNAPRGGSGGGGGGSSRGSYSAPRGGGGGGGGSHGGGSGHSGGGHSRR